MYYKIRSEILDKGKNLYLTYNNEDLSIINLDYDSGASNQQWLPVEMFDDKSDDTGISFMPYGGNQVLIPLPFAIGLFIPENFADIVENQGFWQFNSNSNGIIKNILADNGVLTVAYNWESLKYYVLLGNQPLQNGTSCQRWVLEPVYQVDEKADCLP